MWKTVGISVRPNGKTEGPRCHPTRYDAVYNSPVGTTAPTDFEVPNPRAREIHPSGTGSSKQSIITVSAGSWNNGDMEDAERSSHAVPPAPKLRPQRWRPHPKR
jgi:hypothetical protein